MFHSAGPVLVVAAHPDDEVLGCGGTVARLADLDRQVHLLILGEGVTSRFDPRAPDDGQAARLLDELKGNANQAAAILGAKEPVLCDFRDNRFDSHDLLDLVKAVERVVDEVRPEVVLAQHGGDLNIDHAMTFRAVLTAVRPMHGSPVRELSAFEVPSSTEWAFGRFAPKFEPNYFVDIRGGLDRKIKAMAAYEGESRPFPHPRSPRAIRALAERWGSAVGLEAAEAFHTIFRMD